ncbi:alpha/beta hydrolase-fold protein [Aquimarina hainanensis]|uniref:Alpha/beta hydrolase-fold protein n=1 Tax=Aquimarina hainanensis TaxID=1578017 RepID=A0ABW5NF47_9FLAO
MGYTATHLYLYIETAEDRINYHRRGYLWGDGYKILLGMPKKDSLTDEYYELSYSPSKEKNHWDRQRIMAYNFNQVTKPLSTQSISQEVSTGKKFGFEALIAWSDIEPYHPWFLGEIGCNIYFAKGINSQEHGYITNGYSLVDDEGIWSEEIPKRKYRKITFQLPETVSQPTTIAALRKKNLEEGKPLIVEIASIAKKAVEETIRISCFNKQKEEVLTKEYKIKSSDNLTKENLQVRLEGMSPGIYTVLIQTTEKKLGEHVISIRPEIDGENISTEIQKNKPKLPMGSLHTLQFELNEILNKYRALKPYESGESVHHLWKEFEKKFNVFKQGTDPYKGISGPYRRAFKSKYDQSYQPYSIKLPENYDPAKKYPLLVFLHGSGRDEQGLLKKARSNGKFIEIAPLARDLYNAYAYEESQRDIVEAIEAVTSSFSVDRSRMIIGGFSMGGYGALRAFYEHPELYKGVAVFAGHPNLANEWLDEEHPNFLEDKYLTPFIGVPLFIYHGKKDAGLDVRLIEEMSDKLKKIGGKVTCSIVADKGHEYPDTFTNTKYFNWLDSLIK